MSDVILASKSAARRAVLTGAGVPFEVVVAGVDEDAVKTSMLAQGATPRDVADALAEINQALARSCGGSDPTDVARARASVRSGLGR